MVRRNPILASATQVKLLSDAIFDFTADFGNYRYTLPLNGRPVATKIGVESQPPPQPEDAGVRYQSAAGREQQAVIWAKDAFKLSRVTSDYVYSMDTRLQKAARAHTDALAPDVGVKAVTAPPRMQ